MTAKTSEDSYLFVFPPPRHHHRHRSYKFQTSLNAVSDRKTLYAHSLQDIALIKLINRLLRLFCHLVDKVHPHRCDRIKALAPCFLRSMFHPIKSPGRRWMGVKGAKRTKTATSPRGARVNGAESASLRARLAAVLAPKGQVGCP